MEELDTFFDDIDVFDEIDDPIVPFFDDEMEQYATKRRSNISIASERASLWSLWSQPQPIAAALTRRAIQILVGVLGLVIIAAAFSNMEVVRGSSRNVSTKLRFTVLEVRDGLQDPQLFNIKSVGVMLDDAVVQRATSLVRTGSYLILSFPKPTAWNQFYFETGGRTEQDPVRFALEEWQPSVISGPTANLEDEEGGSAAAAAEERENGRWRTVGSSSELSFHITRTFFHGHYPTSIERGIREVFDQRFVFGCYLGAGAQFLCFGFFLVLSSTVAAAAGKEQFAQSVIIFAELFAAICTGGIAIWYLFHPTSRGTNWNAFYHAVATLQYLVCWHGLGTNQVIFLLRFLHSISTIPPLSGGCDSCIVQADLANLCCFLFRLPTSLL